MRAPHYSSPAPYTLSQSHTLSLSLSLSLSRNSPQWLDERIGCARWMCARIEALIVRIKEKENSKKLHCLRLWVVGQGGKKQSVLEISIDKQTR